MSSAGQTYLPDRLPALAHDKSHPGDADHLSDVNVGVGILITTSDYVVVGGYPDMEWSGSRIQAGFLTDCFSVEK